MEKVLQFIFILVCCCSDIYGAVNYLIELHDSPNCFLDVDIVSNKIIYNCNGGLRFSLVNGNPGVLFQSASDTTKYICHQGFVPHLLPLGGNEHTFYIVNNIDSYVLVRSKDYPTRYLWQNDLLFVFEENKITTTQTKYKFIVCDFSIEKIDRISKYSVEVTINISSPISNTLDLRFVIKCKSPNGIKLFNVTGISAVITELLSNTIYEFSAGFLNEFAILVFGNVSFYRTEKYESYAVAKQISIQRNYCLTTIRALPKDYELSFQVYFTERVPVTTRANIIRLTVGGGDCCNYGERNPMITTSGSGIVICSSINGFGNNCSWITFDIEKWINVTISQFLDNGFYIYTLKFDWKTIFYLHNNDARIFSNVKLYTSDSFSVAQPGYIRNITYKTKTSMISYLIEPYGLPNCFLDVDPLNSKIIYNCNGGIKFFLVTGEQGAILFQSEADNDKYICHQGFVPYLINLSGDDNLFYVENKNDDDFFVRSKIYSTRYLWRDNLDFMFESYKNATDESSFKLIVNDFNIIKIISVTNYSVNITIDAYLSVWNISMSFVIRCVDPNKKRNLYKCTGNSALITSLHSYTVYEFSAGFKNEFGFYVFGNVSYYLTDEDVPSACPVNFTAAPTFSTLVLSWGPVIDSMRNGITIAYLYSCNSTNDVVLNKVNNSTFNITVNNLQQDTVYNCSVAACTRVGCGVQAFLYKKTGSRIDCRIHGLVEGNILNISLELTGSGYNITLEYFFPPFLTFFSENILHGFLKTNFYQTKYTFPGYFNKKVVSMHNITMLLNKRKCHGSFPIKIPVKLSYKSPTNVLKVVTMAYQESLPCLDDSPKISKKVDALKEYYGRGILVKADKSYLFICMNQHAESNKAACYYSNITGNFMTGMDIRVGCVLGHHLVTKELYAIHRNQKLYLYFSVVYKRWIGLTNQQFNKISPYLENQMLKNFEEDQNQNYILGANHWMGNAEGLFYRNDSSNLWTLRVKWSL